MLIIKHICKKWKMRRGDINLFRILGGIVVAASNSPYSYTFLRSVVCLSVFVTVVHPA